MSESIIGGEVSTGNQSNAGGSEGGFDWKSQIPDEYKEHSSLKDIQDFPGLVKSYVHAQSLVGQDKVVLPKDPNDKAAWEDVYTKLGRPNSPEEYGFKKPEGEEYQNVSYDEQFMKDASKKMHELGLSKSQAQALHDWWNQKGLEADKASQVFVAQQQEATVSTLKTEWGQKYDENIALAKRAVNTFGGNEFAKYLDETGLGNDVRLIKAFVQIGQKISGDHLHTGNNSSGFGGMDAASALQKITQKQNDKEFMKIYNDRYHFAHKSAVQEMQELFRIAYN